MYTDLFSAGVWADKSEIRALYEEGELYHPSDEAFVKTQLTSWQAAVQRAKFWYSSDELETHVSQ